MAKFQLGYATGVFDVFHVGHLNLLRNAKSLCDTLIAGVSTDDLVLAKGKRAIVPFEQRIEIVRNIAFVDMAIPQTTTDKVEEWHRLHFDAAFVGDDWFGDPAWKRFEDELPNVAFFYLPYTEGVSSTNLRKKVGGGN